MGPEDRERFARREEGAKVPSLSERDAGLEPQRSIKVVAGGSITEAICGAATVVLAILGLSNFMPGYMASIAVIVFGVALLAQGGALAARYSRILHESSRYGFESEARSEVGGGMGAEMLAGGAGVVMGILGLLGIATANLVPIAIIVFGGALLLGSSATVELGEVGVPAEHARVAHLARQATAAASGSQVLVGIAGIVLGIVALVGIEPLLVTLVGLLVLGAAVLFSGAAVSSRVAGVLRRS